MISNAEQRAAIFSAADVTFVAAGPGGGKTFTLAERIRTRCHGDGVNPKHVVVLTFTNAGAWAFTERLKPLVLGYAGTIHGYGIRLIQAFGDRIGYRAGSVSIVMKETQEALLLATAKRLGYRNKLSKVELFEGKTATAKAVWNEFSHELKRSNMISYDGILIETLKLLRLPEVRDRLHVEELATDETQDSGAIDWEIFDAIPAKRRWHCADPDQCCYVFRGAAPDIFVKRATEPFVLSRNYRSDMWICEAATRLIRNNANRIPKKVIAVSNELGDVTVVEVANDRAEIFHAYDVIRRSGVPLNECAILCRTNAIAAEFRKVLSGLVTMKNTGSIRLPEDWSFVLSAIGLLIDPLNDHHAEQVLRNAVGPKSATDNAIAAWKQHALRGSTSLADVAKLPTATPATLTDALNELCLLGVSDESMELIRQRVATLPNENPTLSDLLADLWNHDKWNVKDDGDGITVTTIHGAKGKEWDLVIVPACEEGILPHLASNEEIRRRGVAPTVDEIEEERRLFFVAITRARHQLVLMHAKQRTAFFKTTDRTPSRFLQEIQ